MMKEKYNIRVLEKQDISKAVALVISSFEKEYLIPSISRGKGIEKFISIELDNKFSPYKYFVLLYENQVAGYLEYKIFQDSTVAFLNIIAVSNAYKQKGIGKKLLEFSMDFFAKKKFNFIQLDVFKTNTVALNWYLGFGFKQKNSNSFFKIELNKNKPEHNSILVQNYPQFKELHEEFGFSLLDTALGTDSFRIGIIEKDLVLRSACSQNLLEELPNFMETMHFENLYYLGNICEAKECKLINEILRMELNIKL